jgi:hypothetical protein
VGVALKEGELLSQNRRLLQVAEQFLEQHVGGRPASDDVYFLDCSNSRAMNPGLKSIYTVLGVLASRRDIASFYFEKPPITLPNLNIL